MKYLYLYINISCIIIPFLFSFVLKHKFYKEWKYFIPANLIISFFFLVWDYYFVEWGVWGFNSRYLTDIYISSIPLEECLFFFCIPYACVFTYFILREYNLPCILKLKKIRISRMIIILASITCLIVSISNYEKLYTFSTFTLLFFLLLFCIINKIDLRIISFSYIFIIPFFLISNGVLTGSFIDEQVVWYNNLENLNRRIFTIPYEDYFYGYLLISLNILLYEKFRINRTNVPLS
tara:strand:+ start:258 stop:965 length:708 start_codon:yes stop_codon:yes gene_type:complete